MTRKPNRPHDMSQLAKLAGDIATGGGGVEDAGPDDAKNPHAVALHRMSYNLCRIHKTLRGTPAVQAGVADHVWTLKEFAELTALVLQKAKPPEDHYWLSGGSIGLSLLASSGRFQHAKKLVEIRCRFVNRL